MAGLLGIIEGNPLLKMLLGKDQFPQTVQGLSQYDVSSHEMAQVWYTLGQTHELFRKFTRRL